MKQQVDVEVVLNSEELDKRRPPLCDHCHNFVNSIWKVIHDTICDKEDRGLNVNVIVIMATEHLANKKFDCKKDHVVITVELRYEIDPTNNKRMMLSIIGHVKSKGFVFR